MEQRRILDENERGAVILVILIGDSDRKRRIPMAKSDPISPLGFFTSLRLACPERDYDRCRSANDGLAVHLDLPSAQRLPHRLLCDGQAIKAHPNRIVNGVANHTRHGR